MPTFILQTLCKRYSMMTKFKSMCHLCLDSVCKTAFINDYRNKSHICVNSGFLQNNLTLCVVLPLVYQESLNYGKEELNVSLL